MKFLFDLDGTVTSKETLPIISEHFGCTEQIAELTMRTVAGNIPFIESFIRRVNILGKYSVKETSDLLAQVPLYPGVAKFILDHPKDCVIVTGNLTCWCESLFKKIGCQCYGSTAEVVDDEVVKLKTILRKEQIVDQYKALGETVVFIGDGNNDLEAMRHANISIAVGLTHNPAQSLLAICDYVIFNENALVRQLRQFCGEYNSGKSVVISCAGIGSRLGLGLTKALVQINGSSLISWQLKLFKEVEDLRLVIGFQATDVIEEVRKYRDDVIFCYNHRYFETKTQLENAQMVDGRYIEVFKHSDAMIHDCGSFSLEYFYAHKPMMFLYEKKGRKDKVHINDVTKEAKSLHYRGDSEQAIEQFIVDVINGIDPMKEQREEFFAKNLTPKGGKSACQNIIDAILGEE